MGTTCEFFILSVLRALTRTMVPFKSLQGARLPSSALQRKVRPGQPQGSFLALLVVRQGSAG